MELHNIKDLESIWDRRVMRALQQWRNANNPARRTEVATLNDFVLYMAGQNDWFDYAKKDFSEAFYTQVLRMPAGDTEIQHLAEYVISEFALIPQ